MTLHAIPTRISLRKKSKRRRRLRLHFIPALYSKVHSPARAAARSLVELRKIGLENLVRKVANELEKKLEMTMTITFLHSSAFFIHKQKHFWNVLSSSFTPGTESPSPNGWLSNLSFFLQLVGTGFRCIICLIITEPLSSAFL